MVRTAYISIISLIVASFIAVIAFIGGWVARDNAEHTPLGVFVSSLLSNQPTVVGTVETNDDFAVFWDVWNLVNHEFYHREPLDPQPLIYGAIKGLLHELGDDYTSFQEPDIAAQNLESMQGKFEGIGAYLRIEDSQIRIDRPIKNSPALRAGLQSGDIILKIDGENIAPLIGGLSDSEATAKVATKIRGPKGSIVTLTILRTPGKEPFDIQITRDEVPLITVNAQMLDHKVAYIQITEFKVTTTAALDEALREILPQKPQSLILDLRDNPGGLLESAQQVLGRFYQGVALYREDSNGSLTQLDTLHAPRDVQVFDIPIVVLVNNHSASAAEIVAGALRDQRPNTTLLGERSFGKGSVQNIHQLRDGSSVRITTAHWFTPNKSAIHKIGITPQYVVPASDDSQYSVPCVSDKQPPSGKTDCVDSQLAWGLRFLINQAPPPAFVPTPTGKFITRTMVS